MPLETLKHNTLEELLAGDLMNLQLYKDRGLHHLLQILLTAAPGYPAFGTPLTGFLGGFTVSPGAGLSVVINPISAATATSALVPGLGLQYDPANTPNIATPPFNAADSPYRLLWLSAATTLNLAAADPANDRIDLVEAQWNLTQASQQQRNIWDPNTKTYVGTQVYKQILPSVTLQVKAGAPGANPMAPALDAGFISVAHVRVPAAAVNIVQGNITDKRTLLFPLVPTLIDEAGGIWKAAITSAGEVSWTKQ